jgi:hypothetical protein
MMKPTDRTKKPQKSAASWSCPSCGRQFARASQAHSCKVRAIDDHFREKNPALRSLFDAIRRSLERSGPLRVDAVKSTINLIGDHHFGAVAVRREYLRIGFLLDREIDDGACAQERIVTAERLGPRRFGYYVVVRTRGDVDEQLLGWLREAQALQSPGHRRGRQNEPKAERRR